MKNLALNDLEVQELSTQEARETNGGGFLCIALGVAVVGAAAAIAWPIIKELWRRRSRRRR